MYYEAENDQIRKAINAVAAEINWEPKDLTASYWRWRGVKRNKRVYCSVIRKFWQMGVKERRTIKAIVVLQIANKVSRKVAEAYGLPGDEIEFLQGMRLQHIGVSQKAVLADMEHRWVEQLPPLDLSTPPAIRTYKPRSAPEPSHPRRVVKMDKTVGEHKIKARDYAIPLVDRVLADCGIEHWPTVFTHQKKTLHHQPGGKSQIVFHYERMKEHMTVGRGDIRGESWLWGQRLVGLEAVHMTALHEAAHAIQRQNGQRHKGSVHSAAWKRHFKELLVLYPFAG